MILKALQGTSQLKTLNLSGNNMPEQVAEDLAIVIKNNPGLEELLLFDNDLKLDALIILQALQENSLLANLDLGNNNMSGQVVESFKCY